MIELPLADIVFPIFVLFSPLLALAFIPLCIVEIVVMARMLKKWLVRVIWPVVFSNIVTTFFGVPLLTIFVAIVPINCKGPGLFNLACWDTDSHATLETGLDMTFFILACWICSFLVEAVLNYWIMEAGRNKSARKGGRPQGDPEPLIDKRNVRKATFWANCASYAFLLVVMVFVFGN